MSAQNKQYQKVEDLKDMALPIVVEPKQRHYQYKRKAGRPPIIDEIIVSKLEQAFAFDCNVSEACVYAGITRETYYQWLKKNPQFSDRIEELQHLPYLSAKQSLLKGVSQSGKLALSFLKARRPQEYSERIQHEAVTPVNGFEVTVIQSNGNKTTTTRGTNNQMGKDGEAA